MKKFVNILFWMVICCYYFVALGFVSGKRSDLLCTDVKITVLDSLLSRFVTTDDILLMVENREHKMRGIQLDSINISRIEQQLSAYPPIRHVNIYKTIDGTVHIDVTQRTPIVRVITRYGDNFYFDEFGELLKHNNSYSAHVLVANGNINFRPPADNSAYNVLTAEYPDGRRNIMRELFELASYVTEDKFWKAQIQQIYVNQNGEFELIPMVGAHLIVFGNFENHEAKFSRLKLFYQNGLSIKGWNNYSEINLKYEGQVIGTKR